MTQSNEIIINDKISLLEILNLKIISTLINDFSGMIKIKVDTTNIQIIVELLFNFYKKLDWRYVIIIPNVIIETLTNDIINVLINIATLYKEDILMLVKQKDGYHIYLKNNLSKNDTKNLVLKNVLNELTFTFDKDIYSGYYL